MRHSRSQGRKISQTFKYKKWDREDTAMQSKLADPNRSICEIVNELHVLIDLKLTKIEEDKRARKGQRGRRSEKGVEKGVEKEERRGEGKESCQEDVKRRIKKLYKRNEELTSMLKKNIRDKRKFFYSQKKKEERSQLTTFQTMIKVDTRLRKFREKLKKSFSQQRSVERKRKERSKNLKAKALQSHYTDDIVVHRDLSENNSDNSIIIISKTNSTRISPNREIKNHIKQEKELRKKIELLSANLEAKNEKIRRKKILLNQLTRKMVNRGLKKSFTLNTLHLPTSTTKPNSRYKNNLICEQPVKTP
ncbi:unnamed protein product [Moneuplotes crassus]|uniref:Uncharacterized protein n=1 Tax=Euplotes crassus TaxID=5936 RepID=A0AAD1U9H7_EUPCR|nr:unnamed protein product [Moneuplotes crassus]